MPDMRDELVERTTETYSPAPRRHIEAVLDSIPPGSFKREDGTWVRLERHWLCSGALVHPGPYVVPCPKCKPVYAEAGHAE